MDDLLRTYLSLDMKKERVFISFALLSANAYLDTNEGIDVISKPTGTKSGYRG
jgi:hypothetical protein